jgi:excisionase family DNA binding protein
LTKNDDSGYSVYADWTTENIFKEFGMKNPKLVGKARCANELGISENQVLRFVRKEGLPCVRLTGKTIRFLLADVREWWLNRRTNAATA